MDKMTDQERLKSRASVDTIIQICKRYNQDFSHLHSLITAIRIADDKAARKAQQIANSGTIELENQRYWDGVYDVAHANAPANKVPKPGEGTNWTFTVIDSTKPITPSPERGKMPEGE
jgi:hypothetical protein